MTAVREVAVGDHRAEPPRRSLARCGWTAPAGRHPRRPSPDGPSSLAAAPPSGSGWPARCTRSVHGPGAPTSLWSARDTWELFPLVGDDPGPGLHALLRRRGAS